MHADSADTLNTDRGPEETAADRRSTLYQETILDHGRNPRNQRAIHDPDITGDAYNPLCGDRVSVYATTGNGRIRQAAFTGSGCAICKASASLMTQTIRGLKPSEAIGLADALEHAITEAGARGYDDMRTLGRLEPLVAVRDYRGRISCALLPWVALRRAIADNGGAR